MKFIVNEVEKNNFKYVLDFFNAFTTLATYTYNLTHNILTILPKVVKSGECSALTLGFLYPPKFVF